MDTKALRFFLLGFFWCLEVLSLDWKKHSILTGYLDPKDVLSVTPLEGGESYDQIFKIYTRQGIWALRWINSHRSLEKRRLICIATDLMGKKGLGPKVIWYDSTFQFLITEFIAGKPLTPDDLEDPLVFLKLSSLLQEAHKALAGLSASLKPYSLRERVLQRLKEVMLSDARIQFWNSLKTKTERVPSSYHSLVHGDIKGANILKAPTGLYLIDWGEVSWASLYDDLGALAFHFQLTSLQEEKLLAAYFAHMPDQTHLQDLKKHRWLAKWHHRLLQIRNKKMKCSALTSRY